MSYGTSSYELSSSPSADHGILRRAETDEDEEDVSLMQLSTYTAFTPRTRCFGFENPQSTEKGLLEKRLLSLHEREQRLRLELDDLEAKKKPLLHEILGIDGELMEVLVKLELLAHPLEDELPSPGPKALRWIDRTVFNLACALVILANLVTILLEIRFDEFAGDFWALDQAFLCFYIIEFSLRVVLHQQNLLVGNF